MMRCQSYLLLSVILIIVGCSNSNTASKSIVLSVESEDGDVGVENYEVLNNSYKKSRQQGIYRIHLLDRKDNIVEEIGFDKLTSSNVKTGSENKMDLMIPLKADMDRVVLYKMDGRSGHYQLDTSEPLFIWAVPDTIRNMMSGNQK